MQVTSTREGRAARSTDAGRTVRGVTGKDISALAVVPKRASNLQTTIATPIHCRGVALHSGLDVDLTLFPADANSGVRFQRSDRPGTTSFPALYDRIVDTRLSTVVACKDDPSLRVATIEHLMAALNALEIDNVLVSVSGPELPVLDGSSDCFAFLIQCAGKRLLEAPRKIIEVLKTVRVEDEHGAFAELRPAQHDLSLAISLSFEASAIGNQRYAMQLTEERFMDEVAFCRTFVNRKDIEHLQSVGLARGGSLDNAIVVDGDTILNPTGLRIEGEFARHKLLDAVGDLYCTGHRMQAGFIGHKSGHALNNRLLRTLFSSPENWAFKSISGTKPMQQTARPQAAA